MKKNNKSCFAKATLMLFLALFTTVNAWAQNQFVDYLEIYSEADWNDFAANVANGTIYTEVVLMADIDVSTMVGTDEHPFEGNFDGRGHSLTIRFGSAELPMTEENVAPFRYVDVYMNFSSTSINNLTVVGYIYTSAKYAAGIVAQFRNDGNAYGWCTLESCVSSVVINSSVNGDGTHGGLVAVNNCNMLYINNCLFDGKLLTTNGTTKCGGFVGWNNYSIDLYHCLYAPAEILSGETEIGGDDTYTFVRRDSDEIDLYKCYYRRRLGNNDQGEQAGNDEWVVDAFTEPDPYWPGTYIQYWSLIAGKVEPSGAWQYNFDLYDGDGSEDYPYLIKRNEDWHTLVNWSKKGINGAFHFKLTQDIGINDPNHNLTVGSDIYPFSGTFDGGNHKIADIDIIETNHQGTAPFREIRGATIKNLTVEGVVRGGTYAAGLVGISHFAPGGNVIDNCLVSTHVINSETSGDRHIGGVVGNAEASKLTISNSVFNGSLSNTGDYAGGLQGWSGSNTLTIENCISTATFVGGATGGFHPVAIKNAGSAVTLSVEGCYYTADPSLTNEAYIAAAGTKASTTAPTGIIYKTITVKGVTVYVEDGPLHITGHGDNTSNGGWYFIASPLKGSVDPLSIENLIGSGSGGVYNYDLYRFDQSADLEWENYQSHTGDFAITNGKGYLYARLFDTDVTFTGEYNTKDTQDVTLDYDPNADAPGWNLVGNPFPTNAYVNKPYYRMNLDGSDIIPVARYWVFDLPVYTGVMVHAENEEDNKVTFSKAEPEPRAMGEGCLLVTLTKIDTSNVEHDRVIVNFNEGIELAKFVFNEDHAKICIPKDGKDYAIAYTEKTGEMPLNFKAVWEGQYTLSVSPEAVKTTYLHLIDNLTGTDVDLLATPVYSFTANASGDYTSRFRLAFSANSVDENGASTSSAAFAFISNGEIVITEASDNAMLQIVDMMGRVVRTVGLSQSGSRITITGTPSGIYILRLIDGETARTQKIVIQ
jgi:hypothetical protein